MLTASIAATIRADYAGLIAALNRRLRDPSLSEELVHEAFVQSLEKLERNEIDDPTRLSGYVYAVAFNLLRNRSRRIENRSDKRISGASLEQLPSETAPDEDLSALNTAELVRRLAAELPTARDRELLQRFDLNEESKADLCRCLQLSALQFDRALFRARRRLRRLLEAHGVQRADVVDGPGLQRRTRVARTALNSAHAARCASEQPRVAAHDRFVRGSPDARAPERPSLA